MSIDMTIVRANLWLILASAAAITILKLAVVWGLFRPTCSHHADALRAGSVLTGASEFAFVLLPVGATFAVLSAQQASILAAITAVTMLMGPPVAALTDIAMRKLVRPDERGPDDFSDARGSVLVVGFGRFGQIVAQCLLAQGTEVTVIDIDPEMIQNASRFGFRIYYGDGTRLDVLRAAGAGRVRLIAICVDDRATANRIVALVQSEFSGTRLHVRSYDRGHTLELLARGVDYELRETYESAIAFGRNTLVGLGVDPQIARAVEADVRSRDAARLAVQQAEGIYAGTTMLHHEPVPEPLRAPPRPATPLNPEAEDIIRGEPGA
jgi:voltage-gated potassium channel Kch